MAQLTNPADDLRARAERAARRAVLHAGPVIRFLARTGFAAKGVVYCLVGGLAVLATVGSRGDVTGSSGALQTLLRQPFGKFILALIAVGLAGYALWCFVLALRDPEQYGHGAKGWGKRAGKFATGIIYAGLVLAVVGMIRGTGGNAGDDRNVQDWTARLMSFPLGIWLVGIVGGVVMAVGARELLAARTTDLDDRLALGRMNPAARRWTLCVSRFGMAARGVVFGVIGGYMARAALHANPHEAKGVAGALRALQSRPHGTVILAVVALGFIAYGVSMLILARHCRIEPA